MSAALIALLVAWGLCLSAAATNEPSFEIMPIYPENQKDVTGVFDMIVQPGQAQQLQVVLANKTAKEGQYTVEVFTAFTNSDGEVEFDGPGVYDETMEYKLSDLLVPVESRFMLAGVEEKVLTFDLTIPPEGFEGYVLGSILVTRKTETAPADGAEAGPTDDETESIGVRVTVHDVLATPAFEMGGVTFTTVNDQVAFISDLRNMAPNIVRGMTVENQVYQKGAEEPIASMRKEEAGMAPNSVYQIPLVDSDGDGFPAGEYISKIRVELNGQVWELSRELTVTQEMAGEVNRNAVDPAEPTQEEAPDDGDAPKPALSPWTVILMVAGVVIFVAALLIFLKLRKEKKEYELYMETMNQKRSE